MKLSLDQNNHTHLVVLVVHMYYRQKKLQEVHTVGSFLMGTYILKWYPHIFILLLYVVSMATDIGLKHYALEVPHGVKFCSPDWIISASNPFGEFDLAVNANIYLIL